MYSLAPHRPSEDSARSTDLHGLWAMLTWLAAYRNNANIAGADLQVCTWPCEHPCV